MLLLEKISFWIRRSRGRKKTLVKGLILIAFGIILILCLENRKWASMAKLKEEADAQIEFFVRSRGTPSSVFVLPDSDTVVFNPQSHCNVDNGSNVFTLFMVVSAPANKAARDVIRAGFKFYLREYNKEVGGHFEFGQKQNTLLFFVGLPQTSSERQILQDEASLHGDLIIDDFNEFYLNLTLKSMRLLKWVEQNCYNAHFTIKVDDDFHINMQKVLDFLEVTSLQNSSLDFVGGKLRVGIEPIRDPFSIYGKWYTTLELWPNETYPDYIEGFFYVMGKSARSKIYKEALLTPLFHLEDVFVTGVVANERLGLKLTNLPRISNHWTPFLNIFMSSCAIQRQYCGIHFHSKYFNYLDCWKDFNEKQFSCNNWPIITHCWFYRR